MQLSVALRSATVVVSPTTAWQTINVSNQSQTGANKYFISTTPYLLAD